MNGLLEILTNKQWMISPDALHAFRAVMEKNIQGHISTGTFDKRKSFAAAYHQTAASDYAQTEEGETYSTSSIARLDKPFVNVIVVDGPVTRNGGACSYGSCEHRDMIMTAADNPNCHGHVIYINTPGGSAWARNDYLQAIEYARSKGQPIYAFIDGVCASAGMYIAAMCDKRFYMHPKNEIGCIGTLAAFYTQKDGSHNEYTDETYHEIYDPESFDKNKWYRDVANEDDNKELIDELSALGAEFRDYVKSRCPNAEEDHLHGKIFNAEEVKGILVDEQSTFGEVIALCFEDGAANIQTDAQNSDEETKDKYRNVAVACGVESLVVDSDGVHLSPDLLDNLSASLNAMADATISLTQDQTEKLAIMEEREKAHREDLNALKASHAEELAEVWVKHESALVAKSDEIAQLKTRLAEAKQTIADRDATIETLTELPSKTPTQSPATNGTGTVVPVNNLIPAYDSTLSPEENKKLRDDWRRKHNL